MDELDAEYQNKLYELKIKVITKSGKNCLGQVIYYDKKLLILREKILEKEAYNYYLVNDSQIQSAFLISTNQEKDNQCEDFQ